MMEITFEYWNKLAEQIITISSLLGGFSIAVIANLLVSDTNTRLSKIIMITATLAAGSFLITVFAMTKLLMMTTEGYPMNVIQTDLMLPRIVGVILFLLGIVSLIAMISLAGWTKSKKLGRFTTTIGILTFLLIILMLT
ncbi:hypothetical protein [Christiangramia forsetii]|uniref:Uncharacterized protein n=1 Tax=Christiangramia forsetii TaxID=411153 RepID=A0ABQ1WCY4_9FLAO|nr:hypothetical protein [Christiangramia forsetii]GGG25646.1 hypothetical protein GCM10011532_06220 [Christiangramia forsetii]